MDHLLGLFTWISLSYIFSSGHCWSRRIQCHARAVYEIWGRFLISVFCNWQK